MKTKTTHRWTTEQEALLYHNRNLSPKKIKELVFKNIGSISVQAIADKLSRVIDKIEQANYGKSWTTQEIDFLKKNIELPTAELKKSLKRGSKEINQAKYDIRHYGEIKSKNKSWRSTPRSRVINKKKVSTKNTSDKTVSGNGTSDTIKNSKLITQFHYKNGLVHFILKTRVHESNAGVKDLAKVLRACADRLESNNNFTMNDAKR